MAAGSSLFGDKGKQGNDPGPFNSQGQSPLMFCTGPGNPARQYLSPICDKPAQHIRVFVVYLQLLSAEFADFLLKKALSFTTPPTPVFTVPAIHLALRASVLPGMLVFYIFFIRHNYSLKLKITIPVLKTAVTPSN
jgi:hypothetical protein